MYSCSIICSSQYMPCGLTYNIYCMGVKGAQNKAHLNRSQVMNKSEMLPLERAIHKILYSYQICKLSLLVQSSFIAHLASKYSEVVHTTQPQKEGQNEVTALYVQCYIMCKCTANLMYIICKPCCSISSFKPHLVGLHACCFSVVWQVGGCVVSFIHTFIHNALTLLIYTVMVNGMVWNCLGICMQ